MKGFFDPNDVEVRRIDWNAGNSDEDRYQLALNIKTAIRNYRFAPGEQNNIVCHSHGCNGVMAALPTLLEDGFFVNNLITLGGPRRSDYPYTGGVGDWFNIYATNDLIQKLGGSPPGFGGRTNPNAYNIPVDAGSNPKRAHGNLHTDGFVRAYWESMVLHQIQQFAGQSDLSTPGEGPHPNRTLPVF